MQDLNPITAPELTSERVRHGFFTRDGGVSSGIYSGLNVGIGSNDTPKNVTENRRRVCSYFSLPPEALGTVFQQHSPDVFIANADWQAEQRPMADAIVTKRDDIAIGVVTADCGPVLFAEHESGIIGAAHAGWKGATGGVLENTIDAMITLGAKRDKIITALGPTISQSNYEVGPEFVDRLVQLNKHNTDYLTQSTNDNHAMFDLPAYIINRLKNVGVSATWTGQCTYANDGLLFSYRRTTHRKEPDYGRQISAIRIANA